MKCPTCQGRKSVAIDTHSDGFSSGGSPVKECIKCGTVWRVVSEMKGNRIDIIKKPTKA